MPKFRSAVPMVEKARDGKSANIGWKVKIKGRYMKSGVYGEVKAPYTQEKIYKAFANAARVLDLFDISFPLSRSRLSLHAKATVKRLKL